MLRLCLIAIAARLLHAATQGPPRYHEQEDDTAVMLALRAVQPRGDRASSNQSLAPGSDSDPDPPKIDWGPYNEAAKAGGTLLADAIGHQWGGAFNAAATVACSAIGGPAGALIGASFSLIGGLFGIHKKPNPLPIIEKSLNSISTKLDTINDKLNALKSVIDLVSENVLILLRREDLQTLEHYLEPFNEVHGVFQYTLGIMELATNESAPTAEYSRVQLNTYRDILRDEMKPYLPYDQTYQKMNLDWVICAMKSTLNMNQNNERHGRCTAAMAYQHMMSTRAELMHLQVDYWGMDCDECGQASQRTYFIDTDHPHYQEINASINRTILDMVGYGKFLEHQNLTSLIGVNESSLQSMMAHLDEYPDFKLTWPEELGNVPKSFQNTTTSKNAYISMVGKNASYVPEGYRRLHSGSDQKDRWANFIQAHTIITTGGDDNDPDVRYGLIGDDPHNVIVMKLGAGNFPVTVFLNDCIPSDPIPAPCSL